METTPQKGVLTPRPFAIRHLAIVGVGITATGAALWLPPITQNPAYHNFADQRSALGIPNMLNVISNAPFLVVGGLGVGFL